MMLDSSPIIAAVAARAPGVSTPPEQPHSPGSDIDPIPLAPTFCVFLIIRGRHRMAATAPHIPRRLASVPDSGNGEAKAPVLGNRFAFTEARASWRPFFHPRDHPGTRHPNYRLEPSSTASLFRSSQNLFPTFFGGGMRGRIFTAWPLACSRALVLLSVGCSTVPSSWFAPTMGTMKRDRSHETFHLSHDFCSCPPTAFCHG